MPFGFSFYCVKNISISFPHKLCFKDFSADILCGNRIAIIGRNGSGKSTLLKILKGECEPTDGKITVPKDLRMNYVPQVIEDFKFLSGGQRFNEALTRALVLNPDVLLLDEPTNHLSCAFRRILSHNFRLMQWMRVDTLRCQLTRAELAMTNVYFVTSVW